MRSFLVAFLTTVAGALVLLATPLPACAQFGMGGGAGGAAGPGGVGQQPAPSGGGGEDEADELAEELNNEDPCARYLPEDDGPIDSVDTIAPAPEAPKPEEDAPMGIEARAEQPQGGGRAGYSRTKDNLLSTRELPPGIVVTGVITSHHRSAQNEGKAAIHFFPGGYAERAMVWLGEKPNPEEDAEPEVTLALEGQPALVQRLRAAAGAGHLFHELDLSFVHGDLHIAGQVDLVWKDDAGRHILDYKWGASEIPDAETTARDLGSTYLKQVYTYAEGFQAAWPDETLVDYGLWFCAHDVVDVWKV